MNIYIYIYILGWIVCNHRHNIYDDRVSMMVQITRIIGVIFSFHYIKSYLLLIKNLPKYNSEKVLATGKSRITQTASLRVTHMEF